MEVLEQKLTQTNSKAKLNQSETISASYNRNVENSQKVHTICPCLAAFLISVISFFSWVCSPCLSLSISLIDLSNILLFSLNSSTNKPSNHQILKPSPLFRQYYRPNHRIYLSNNKLAKSKNKTS